MFPPSVSVVLHQDYWDGRVSPRVTVGMKCNHSSLLIPPVYVCVCVCVRACTVCVCVGGWVCVWYCYCQETDCISRILLPVEHSCGVSHVYRPTHTHTHTHTEFVFSQCWWKSLPLQLHNSHLDKASLFESSPKVAIKILFDSSLREDKQLEHPDHLFYDLQVCVRGCVYGVCMGVCFLCVLQGVYTVCGAIRQSFEPRRIVPEKVRVLGGKGEGGCAVAHPSLLSVQAANMIQMMKACSNSGAWVCLY